MDIENNIYRDLQKYLDRLPGGFPATESGADIRLLKRLFTTEEAQIALQLSMNPEPVKRIYYRVKKTGISIEELHRLLESMVHKGTILANDEGYSERHYSNAGFSAGGIYNFQVNRLPAELIIDYRQYMNETRSKPKLGTKRILPLRTIPVEKSIPLPEKHLISNYDNVRKLIENTRGKIAVANCICRQSRDILGEKCLVTELQETCLMIAPDHAKRHVEMGIGRYVSKEEALDILSKAQDAGLVLQPETSQRPEAICCCCGDCCVLFKQLKKHPRPADVFLSNYYAAVEPESCTGCKLCVERCPLEARMIIDDIAAVKLERCIGCGNCVTICPANSNRLIKKTQEISLPKDKTDFNMKVLSKRVGKLNMLKVRARSMLGLKV